MPGSGYQDPTGITVDDGSMEGDAELIGTQVDALSLNNLKIVDYDSTVTVKNNGNLAYHSAQTVNERFIEAITQDAMNILSVLNDLHGLDDELKVQLESLSD